MKMRLLLWTLVFMALLSSACCDPPVPKFADVNKDASPSSFNLRTESPGNITASWTLNDEQLKLLQSRTTTLYLPLLYLLAFVVGLPSNLLALWVLFFRTKVLPSTALLINLTVIDSLLLLVLPFRISYHFRGNRWELGEPFCRFVMAMFYGNMYGSVLCLAFVALDRYLVVVHPFGALTLRSRRTSLLMTAVVWVVVLAAMLPLLVLQQSYKPIKLNITICHDALPEDIQRDFSLPYFATLFSSCFLLPFVVILFCHGAVLRTLLAKGKRFGHAIRVIVLVLLVFVACVLPSNVLLLITYLERSDRLYVPYMVSLAVSTFNSCIDPFIFYYVSAEFREKARSAFLRCRSRKTGDKPTTCLTPVT